MSELDDLRREVYLKGIDQVRYPFFQEEIKILMLGEEGPSK